MEENPKELEKYREILSILDILYITRIQKERFADIEEYEKVKDFLVELIARNKTFDDSFYEVLKFLDDAHKRNLCMKISSGRALMIANSIEDKSKKSEALAAIARKTADKDILEKALTVANSIDDDRGKSNALEAIVGMTADKDILEKALTVAHSIDDRRRTNVVSEIAVKN